MDLTVHRHAMDAKKVNVIKTQALASMVVRKDITSHLMEHALIVLQTARFVTPIQTAPYVQRVFMDLSAIRHALDVKMICVIYIQDIAV